MNTIEDHVYEGSCITGMLIENGISMSPIHSVFEDSNGDVIIISFYNTERMFNSDLFSVGQKLTILNPYLRKTMDGSVIIRVDDPKSILFDDLEKICWCCSQTEEDAGKLKHCSRCQRALYCSRECQQFDWKSCDHSSVCY